MLCKKCSHWMCTSALNCIQLLGAIRWSFPKCCQGEEWSITSFLAIIPNWNSAQGSPVFLWEASQPLLPASWHSVGCSSQPLLFCWSCLLRRIHWWWRRPGALSFQEVSKHFSHIRWYSSGVAIHEGCDFVSLLATRIRMNMDLYLGTIRADNLHDVRVPGESTLLVLFNSHISCLARSWRTITCSSAATFAGSPITMATCTRTMCLILITLSPIIHGITTGIYYDQVPELHQAANQVLNKKDCGVSKWRGHANHFFFTKGMNGNILVSTASGSGGYGLHQGLDYFKYIFWFRPPRSLFLLCESKPKSHQVYAKQDSPQPTRCSRWSKSALLPSPAS